MKNLFIGTLLSLSLGLVGCAGAKVKDVRVSLQPGAISKSDLILVKKISADRAEFSGDKAGDSQRVTEEKQMIRDALGDAVVQELRSKGLNAALYQADKADGAIVIDGAVTKVDHGSGAARYFLRGMGGSSNMALNVRIYKGGRELIGDFDVAATSGAKNGVGSFVKDHVEDGAKQTADYIAKQAM